MSSGAIFSPIDAGPVRLRPIEERDAADVAALMSPGISRWVLSWPERLTPGEAAERIARVRADVEAGAGHYFIIERSADARFVGWISLTWSRDDTSRGVLGYWLGEVYHGHGYMSAAAAAVVRVAFDALGLDFVEAGANPENSRSFAIMRRIGMKPAGERTLWSSARGCSERCHFYEMSRAEYEAARNQVTHS